MKRKLSALLASLVLVLGLLAPLASTVSAAGKKKVMTTFYPVYYLAQQESVDMPITNALYRVLFEDVPVKNSVRELMDRDKKAE